MKMVVPCNNKTQNGRKLAPSSLFLSDCCHNRSVVTSNLQTGGRFVWLHFGFREKNYILSVVVSCWLDRYGKALIYVRASHQLPAVHGGILTLLQDVGDMQEDINLREEMVNLKFSDSCWARLAVSSVSDEDIQSRLTYDRFVGDEAEGLSVPGRTVEGAGEVEVDALGRGVTLLLLWLAQHCPVKLHPHKTLEAVWLLPSLSREEPDG